ncbi:hypothetical protein ABZ319_19255 [Nocardia sp. NPDC005978]|uniref:LGFP repeat-containing protein n=1 Tax=Nocardia sp. NPDC005978 TaxID=3156725 RepID=UPI0033A848EB
MSGWKRSFAGAAAFAAVLLGAGSLTATIATAQPAGAEAAIDAHYTDKGGAATPLGEKVGAVYAFGPDGAAQDYRGGKIIYSADTGAKVMYGAILDKYLALGGADAVGYPTNDESDVAVAGTARFSEFSAPDGATIQWSPQNGAWLVRGPIRTAWSELNATDGVLGAPTSDTTLANGVYSQSFTGQNGEPVQIQWSQADGFVSTPPAIAGQLSGLDVSAPGAPPGDSMSSGAAPAPATGSDSNAKWWALPIGLLIAAAAGGLAMLATRSRGHQHHSVGTTAAGAHRAPTGTAGAPVAAAGGQRHTAGAHLATLAERARTFGGGHGRPV